MMPFDPEARLVASPCSNPKLPLEGVLAAYSGLGYRKFEAFTSWAASAFDFESDPAAYLETAGRFNMTFSSMHLPRVDGSTETLAAAVRAARFAGEIAAGVVIFKADSRENYIAVAQEFLDGVEGLSVTPVLQNHSGTPLTTLEDILYVRNGIDDARMKTLLEVGHLHSAGVTWREAYEALQGSIALVHIKDQLGKEPVPFGEGEIDLAGLFRRLGADGYAGDYVVEMEVPGTGDERTFELMGRARDYICRIISEL